MWKWIRRRDAPTPPGASARQPVSELAIGKVTTRPRKVAGRHAALYEYLEHRYADVIVLTFAQIEDLLGFALPDPARSQQEWWTLPDPHGDTSSCSDAWISAGRTASPNLPARTVTFERATSRQTPAR